MAVNLSPIWGAGAQLLDNSGNVLSGGKIYTYAAGTTTQVTTYTSNNGVTANSNPIVLNSAGRVPYEIWLTDGQNYKFVLKDSNDVLIGTWDNLSGINSNFIAYTNEQEIQTATAGQTVFALTTMQYLPGTNSLSVFVDGVNQYGPGAQYAYEETDQTTITFASGLHVGAEVKFTSSQIQNSGVADASQISYTYPDVNAVTQNVEERLAQYVNVKDFGAVGDGVTDDTAAIQNAIDTGLNVYAVNGKTYKTTSSITVDTTYQIIDFQNAKLLPNGSFNAITLTASNGGIKNVWIDGTDLTGDGIVTNVACQSFVIEGCIIDNCESAISMVDVYTCWFNKNLFRYNTVSALTLDSTIVGTPVNSVWINDCTFAANTTTGNIVELSTVAGVWLTNCNWQNNDGSNSVDVNVKNGSTQVVVQNCYFENGASKTGKSVSFGDNTGGDLNNTYGCLIENSYFQTSKQPVYYGTHALETNKIVKNVFNSVTGSPSYAVQITASNFVPIVYNNAGSISDINRSFTPSLQFGSASTGITYTAQTGYWQRIDNTITGVVEIELSNKGSATGSAIIINLPKAAGASSIASGSFLIVMSNMSSLTGAVFGRTPSLSSGIYLAQQTSTGYVDLAETNFTNTSLVEMSFTINL